MCACLSLLGSTSLCVCNINCDLIIRHDEYELVVSGLSNLYALTVLACSSNRLNSVISSRLNHQVNDVALSSTLDSFACLSIGNENAAVSRYNIDCVCTCLILLCSTADIFIINIYSYVTVRHLEEI